MASQLSLPEYNPSSIVADEMRETLKEVWGRVLDATAIKLDKKSKSPTRVKGQSRAGARVQGLEA